MSDAWNDDWIETEDSISKTQNIPCYEIDDQSTGKTGYRPAMKLLKRDDNQEISSIKGQSSGNSSNVSDQIELQRRQQDKAEEYRKARKELGLDK